MKAEYTTQFRKPGGPWAQVDDDIFDTEEAARDHMLANCAVFYEHEHRVVVRLVTSWQQIGEVEGVEERP